MIRIAICDDEEIIQQQLYNIISDYLERRSINAEILTFSSGKDLLEKAKIQKISCFFMDIDLNEKLNGVEIVKLIREYQKKSLVVFITSYAEYINKVLSLHTFDYIIKPFKNSEIHKMLDDLFCWIETEKEEVKKMQFKTINGLVSLNIEDIVYFEYKNRRIDIVTKTHVYHMYDKIREVYERVKAYDFAVPHISFIVNMKEIEMIVRGTGKIIMTNSEEIPVSQLKIKKFRYKYMQYLKKVGEKIK